MPVGIERLNARRQIPNSRIVFIKPLPGPTSKYAEDFLERVAAICHPIMKSHHLSVMSLEEYEPNREFIGRNFNAGEVIQLVLKGHGGGWMSFRSVVMVMMHELAHCVQMNHGKKFWEVRNLFAGEMRGLWTKGYTGDGFWGHGKTLLSGEYENQAGLKEEEMPDHLCGGTFRSRRGRKRKRGKSGVDGLSYAEKKQRRIAKKFGINGVKLGDDEEVRVKLEQGKRPKGKPRVAGSARGRELRAAAALARFGQQQKREEKDEVVKREEETSDSGSESATDGEDVSVKGEDATDLNGKKLLDVAGKGMIKVCEDEDTDDIHVKEEMQELQDINEIAQAEELLSKKQVGSPSPHIKAEPSPAFSVALNSSNTSLPLEAETKAVRTTSNANTQADKTRSIGGSCPICSMENDPSSLLCMVCSHVLDARKSPGSWSCRSETCKDSQYVNAADCGLCGICGERKHPV